MRRVFLLVVIIGMCMLVAVGGTMTFLNSDSVLKDDAEPIISSEMQRNTSIFADLKKDKLYLISEGRVFKTYSIGNQSGKTPSPTGEWKVSSKSTIGRDMKTKWIGINTPWGKYGIHNGGKSFRLVNNPDYGAVYLENNDMEELFNVIVPGTKIAIYDGSDLNPFLMERKLLKPGDRGGDVYKIQKKLKQKGYYKGYLDGVYNAEMKSAVHEFQNQNKLPKSDYINYLFCIKIGIFMNI